MRISRILSFAALLLTMAFGGAFVAGADHTTYDGPAIADGPLTLASQYEQTLYKGDPGSGPGGNVECGNDLSRTYKLDAGEIAVGAEIALNGGGVVKITAFDGKTLDWEIVSLGSTDAYDVIVKGGPAATIYSYGHDNRADEGFGLTAPVNPNNGKYYGISNVTFCFDDKG